MLKCNSADVASFQVAACPAGSQAATRNIVQAYHCSPLAPCHKKYIVFHWNNNFYVQHNVIEGLAPARGIQGAVADACIAILNHHGIAPISKWVDDFIIFCSPSQPLHSPLQNPSFNYDLASLLHLTDPLRIPWHPISKKGQDFDTSFVYLGFRWDLSTCSISIPDEKRTQTLAKLNAFINISTSVTHCDCVSLHGTLQHLSFVVQDGHSFLPSLSTFLAKFSNNFIWHHIPSPFLCDLRWWQACLALPTTPCSLTPHPHLDPSLFVGASTSHLVL